VGTNRRGVMKAHLKEGMMALSLFLLSSGMILAGIKEESGTVVAIGIATFVGGIVSIKKTIAGLWQEAFRKRKE